MPPPKKPAGSTALMRVRKDLADKVAGLAKAKGLSVAELIEESPLRAWVLTEELKLFDLQMEKRKATEKELAALRSQKK